MRFVKILTILFFQQANPLTKTIIIFIGHNKSIMTSRTIGLFRHYTFHNYYSSHSLLRKPLYSTAFSNTSSGTAR